MPQGQCHWLTRHQKKIKVAIIQCVYFNKQA